MLNTWLLRVDMQKLLQAIEGYPMCGTSPSGLADNTCNCVCFVWLIAADVSSLLTVHTHTQCVFSRLPSAITRFSCACLWLASRNLVHVVLQATPVRIVAVSSDVHSNKGFDVEDLNFRRRPYSRATSYHQSKLCNILFIKELANRCAFGLHLLVVHTAVCSI